MNAISMTDPRLKPASTGEIEDALRLLCNSLKAPEGVDFPMLLDSYRVALEGYPRWAIANAARKFLRGEVEGQSKAFCPRPPELGEAVKAETAPVHAKIQREMERLKLRREAAEFAVVIEKTPASRLRSAAIYAAFCETYSKSTKPEGMPRLDPTLVEQVPDSPTTWERMKWEKRGGDRG